MWCGIYLDFARFIITVPTLRGGLYVKIFPWENADWDSQFCWHGERWSDMWQTQEQTEIITVVSIKSQHYTVIISRVLNMQDQLGNCMTQLKFHRGSHRTLGVISAFFGKKFTNGWTLVCEDELLKLCLVRQHVQLHSKVNSQKKIWAETADIHGRKRVKKKIQNDMHSTVWLKKCLHLQDQYSFTDPIFCEAFFVSQTEIAQHPATNVYKEV